MPRICMAYLFQPAESIADNARRIAAECMDESLSLIDDPKVDPVEIVHEIRKLCKKLRSLFRLIYPTASAMVRREMRVYRDIGRLLSETREAQILVPVFDDLMESGGAGISQKSRVRARMILMDLRREIEVLDGGVHDRTRRAKRRFSNARKRVAQAGAHSFGEPAVEYGWIRGRERALVSARKAREEPTVERYHDWRKRAKTHWYHTQLLEPLWPEGLSEYGEALYQLTDCLGSDRDLYTLKSWMKADAWPESLAKTVAEIARLADVRQAELQENADVLSTALVDFDPASVTARLPSSWR